MAVTVFYHVTNPDAATEIERNGFIDGEGYYGLNIEEPLRGVFLSDTILDANEGAWGEIVLAVEIDEQLIVARELPEEGRNYREWHVPAELLNARASISRV